MSQKYDSLEKECMEMQRNLRQVNILECLYFLEKIFLLENKTSYGSKIKSY